MIRRLLDFEEGIEGLQLQVDPASVQRVPSGFPTKPSKLVARLYEGASNESVLAVMSDSFESAFENHSLISITRYSTGFLGADGADVILFVHEASVVQADGAAARGAVAEGPFSQEDFASPAKRRVEVVGTVGHFSPLQRRFVLPQHDSELAFTKLAAIISDSKEGDVVNVVAKVSHVEALDRPKGISLRRIHLLDETLEPFRVIILPLFGSEAEKFHENTRYLRLRGVKVKIYGLTKELVFVRMSDMSELEPSDPALAALVAGLDC